MKKDETKLVPVPSPNIIPERDVDKTPILEVSHLGIDFGGLAAVSEFNMAIGRTEIAGLIGPNGAGKTTLIHLLAGLQEPDGGQVYLLGRDLGEMKEEERTLFRRRHISLVLQEGALLPGLTVEENILLPMAMDTGRLVEEERLEQILEALGLTRLRRRFPARLSGGERQRVVLGRALLSDAEIILADEPTGNLDTENTRNIVALLKEMAHEHGCTVVVVTHDEDVANEADYVYRMDSGRLVVDEK